MKRITQTLGQFATSILAFLLAPVAAYVERMFVLHITPMTSGAFGDILDPRFQKIFYEEKAQLKSLLPDVYTMIGTNGRNVMTFSEVGTLSDWDEFNGTVPYTSLNQGYDVTMTPLEFAKGIQVERKLFDDDQFHIMDQRPKGLVTSGHRKREKDGARIFNNAFSNDTYFYQHSEGVSLCSASHTTNSGASTASGFNNLSTSSMTAVAVFAKRLQMVGFRGDQAEKIDIEPDELWYPPDLAEQAWEIIKSNGKLDVANNNVNFHQGRYTPYEWRYLSSTKNWFMCDGRMRKMYLFWSDRIPTEFAMVEDFDTLIAKWRGYMRYAMTYTNWRWLSGALVG